MYIQGNCVMAVLFLPLCSEHTFIKTLGFVKASLTSCICPLGNRIFLIMYFFLSYLHIHRYR